MALVGIWYPARVNPSHEGRDLPNSMLESHAYGFHLYKDGMFRSGYLLEKWGGVFRLQSLQMDAQQILEETEVCIYK